MAKRKKPEAERGVETAAPNVAPSPVPEEPGPKLGRPSSYTPEIGGKICGRLSDGESLRSICRSDDMPDKSTVFRWLLADAIFRDQYARARDEQADTLAEEILDISDDGSNDWMVRHGKDGEDLGWQVNGEHIQRSRLRVDSRKWYAGKVAPKKYGDKQQLEHSGTVTFADLADRLKRAKDRA